MSIPQAVPSGPSEPAAQPMPPAGFYPDSTGQPRWWDGTQWTNFAPALTPQPQSQLGAPVDILPGGAVSGSALAAPRPAGIGGIRVVGYRQGPVGLAVLLLVGFGMLIGAYLLHGSSGHASQTASVTGVVQSTYSHVQAAIGGDACAPTVAYTVAGVGYSVHPSVATSSLCGFSVGSPVQVLYDPSDPAQAHLPAVDSANLGTVLALGVFGLVVLAFALLPYLSRRD